MTTKMKKIDNTVVICVTGDVDLFTAPDLKIIMNEYLKKHKRLILSLCDVKYIDSSGIGLLLHLFSECTTKNVHITFCDIQETVFKIIKLTQLHNFLPLFSSVETSIEFINGKERA